MRILTLLSVLILSLAACSPAPQGGTKSSGKGIVLVAGATGKTGSQVVNSLLAEGFSVRAFVRDAERAKTTLPSGVDLAVGDVKDPASIGAAMSGVTDIISAIGSMAPKGPNSPEFVDYGGVKNLVDAGVEAGIDQFVLVSSMGATKEDHFLNKRFGNVLIWKLKGENHLRASGLDYTVVRPGGLTDTPARQAALELSQGDEVESGQIPRADVAEICVAALSASGSRGKTFEVITGSGGPARNWQALFAGVDSD